MKIIMGLAAFATFGLSAPLVHADGVGDQFRDDCHAIDGQVARIVRDGGAGSNSTYSLSGPGAGLVASWDQQSTPLGGGEHFQFITAEVNAGYVIPFIRQHLLFDDIDDDTIENNGNQTSAWVGAQASKAHPFERLALCIVAE